MSKKRTFVILGGAELPWIYPLGVALSKAGFTTAIRLGVSRSLFSHKVAWPFEENPENFNRVSWTYPPGFNGTLSCFFTFFIRARLKKLIRYHVRLSGEHPFVITSDPKFLPYLQYVDPSCLIYLNYDDLSVEHPLTGYSYLPEEEKLIGQVSTIFCSSYNQKIQFEQRFEDKTKSIFHLPHGVNELFIYPELLPSFNEQTVCAVGVLSSRYDWKLIYDVAIKLPNVKFLFVGNIANVTTSQKELEWKQNLNKVLSLSNVSHLAGLPHRETPQYFWTSSVNWMPYQANLRFVQAGCPLKLMDGIASGRPVISADVPECRLYPEWVCIYKSADEAVALITHALAESPESQQRREDQIHFAWNNTWAVRAKKMLDILERPSCIY